MVGRGSTRGVGDDEIGVCGKDFESERRARMEGVRVDKMERGNEVGLISLGCNHPLDSEPNLAFLGCIYTFSLTGFVSVLIIIIRGDQLELY